MDNLFLFFPNSCQYFRAWVIKYLHCGTFPPPAYRSLLARLSSQWEILMYFNKLHLRGCPLQRSRKVQKNRHKFIGAIKSQTHWILKLILMVKKGTFYCHILLPWSASGSIQLGFSFGLDFGLKPPSSLYRSHSWFKYENLEVDSS